MCKRDVYAGHGALLKRCNSDYQLLEPDARLLNMLVSKSGERTNRRFRRRWIRLEEVSVNILKWPHEARRMGTSLCKSQAMIYDRMRNRSGPCPSRCRSGIAPSLPPSWAGRRQVGTRC